MEMGIRRFNEALDRHITGNWGEDAPSDAKERYSGNDGFDFKRKWVSTDGMRGYNQPIGAVVGSSDTGTWSDSPCPSHVVKEELRAARKALATQGIECRTSFTTSSNGFMVKRWLLVREVDKARAKVVIESIQEHRFLHGAD